jgi:cytoskeletal protein CcmA (bactofilin family)
MNTQPLGDISISGIASSSGGTFNQVNIDGVGKIRGDVTCQQFQANGTAKVEGNLQADIVRINGMSTIKGAVRADSMQMDGKVTIQGPLTCDSIHFNGDVKIGANCSAEQFQASGTFVIEGMLNAGNIMIHIHGRCRANEIGGEQITVKQIRGNLMNKMMGALFNSHLSAEVIEGDHVTLENTKAQVVRGNQVVIGPDCVIDRVEYKEHLHIHPSAKVNHQLRL